MSKLDTLKEKYDKLKEKLDREFNWEEYERLIALGDAIEKSEK